jgi:2-haloacid dehalogenase
LITAEQAEAYKPSRAIFKHAYRELGTTKGRCGAYLCEPASRSGRGARHRLPLHLDRPRHGPQAVADYTSDRTFTTLDQVPAFFAEIGWSD